MENFRSLQAELIADGLDKAFVDKTMAELLATLKRKNGLTIVEVEVLMLALLVKRTRSDDALKRLMPIYLRRQQLIRLDQYKRNL